jgi:hypothetical protein
MTDIPGDIKDKKDITLRLYDFYPFELFLFFSIEAKKFYIKYADTVQEGNYVDLGLFAKLEDGSEIIQLDYESGNELITIVYYNEALRQVKARGFTIWANVQ